MGCLFAFAVVMGFVLLFGYDNVLESRWFFSGRGQQLRVAGYFLCAGHCARSFTFRERMILLVLFL